MQNARDFTNTLQHVRPLLYWRLQRDTMGYWMSHFSVQRFGVFHMVQDGVVDFKRAHRKYGHGSNHRVNIYESARMIHKSSYPR